MGGQIDGGTERWTAIVMVLEREKSKRSEILISIVMVLEEELIRFNARVFSSFMEYAIYFPDCKPILFFFSSIFPRIILSR